LAATHILKVNCDEMAKGTKFSALNADFSSLSVDRPPMFRKACAGGRQRGIPP